MLSDKNYYLIHFSEINSNEISVLHQFDFSFEKLREDKIIVDNRIILIIELLFTDDFRRMNVLYSLYVYT